MPIPQAAVVISHGFAAQAGSGNPVAGDRALKFKIQRGGGVLSLLFSNENATDVLVTVRTSSDDITYNALDATKNLTTIANVLVAAKTPVDKRISLHDGYDNYIDVLARGAGGGDMVMQVRGPDILQNILV